MAGAPPDPKIAGIEYPKAQKPPEQPPRRCVLRRRQHHDGRRLNFPLRQGPRRAQVLRLARRGRFTLRQAKLRTRGESKGDMHATRDSALAFVAGKKVTDVVALGEEIYDETMADKIWSGTLALARAHLAAGRRVWLVTATPQELAEIIADRLGLTGALGTVAETIDGKYTGLLVGDVLHGEAKAHAVQELAAREGLDLAQCSAYSDSINDIPMLSLVGTAVAVNPDSALRAEAARSGMGDSGLPHRSQGDPGRRAHRSRRVRRSWWGRRRP